MVMERMAGIPIGRRSTAASQAGIDLKRLARAGVEIFFTQVFRDGFFHADMHPGQHLRRVDAGNHGKYIALDFGIMGTLSEQGQELSRAELPRVLPPRLPPRRDGAHRVRLGAGGHARRRARERRSASCCEPIFDRPLKEISLGKVLVQLFRASRRFNVEIQPQLVLLQKTLLNVEGLGRQLDPDLDLWVTAKPFLERWMDRPDRLARARAPAARGSALHSCRRFPSCRGCFTSGCRPRRPSSEPALIALARAQQSRNRWLAVIAVLLIVVIALLLRQVG